MIRERVRLGADDGRLPRMRGDDPDTPPSNTMNPVFAPHARG